MRPSAVRRLAASAVASSPAKHAAAAGRTAAAAAGAGGAAAEAAAAASEAAAVPWYRKKYYGSEAQTMWQAAWGVSLALLFIGIPLVGTTVQTTMREQNKRRMLEENSREREAFLRDLYGLKGGGVIKREEEEEDEN